MVKLGRVTAVTIEEHEAGLTWVVDEPMRRASHALADGDRVWLVDPIDAADALERAGELGRPEAVLQLLDRHNRDCVEIARRLDIPHLKVPEHVPRSPFEALPVLRLPLWKETALWWPERRTLIVAEVLGTSPLYTARRDPVGMHIALRPLPPGSLRAYRPDHLLVGHGRPVHGADAAAGPERAYSHARGELPHVLRSLAARFRRD